ncbi:MAG: Hpt domain-containing protein [Candidatus Accumulibacter sp.]|jgi:chemosensory pili system protein ChpA (sensor histidine kinase/response regulator)|nr:Hpt domain-containing protein [Accumulibacter sp.]
MNDTVTEFDVGPLVWVKTEIDQALTRARQAFQQYAAASASGGADRIRLCRTHLHQVKGALAIVGLDGIRQFVEALESLLDAIEQTPPEKLPTPLILSSIDSVGHYIDDLLAGQPDQPLRLYPIYEQIQRARGVDRVSKSELFFPDLDARLPKSALIAPALDRISPDLFQGILRRERNRFQRGFLSWLKNPADRDGVHEMLQAIRRVEATQQTNAMRAFWWIVGVVLSALGEGGLPENFDAKQLCARVDLQIRRLSEGSKNIAERLMRDLLYFIASSENPIFDPVKEVYRLDALIPEASLVSTTPREIVRRKLRDVITIAGDAWNKYCAGATASFEVFVRHTRILAETVDQLGQADFRRLARAILDVADWLNADGKRFSEALAMETATAILLAQSAQKDFQGLGDDFAHQVDVAVSRIRDCLAGTPSGEGARSATLDEMSSKAQEKLLVEQVVKEIRINLAQIEHVLDDFFRDAAKRAELETLDAPIRQIAGALTILQHEKAVDALNECQKEIRRFSRADYVPENADFERIASQLSIIGLFIDSIPYAHDDFTCFFRKIQSELATSAAPSAKDAEGAGGADRAEGSEGAEGTERTETLPPMSFEQEVEQKKERIQSLLAELKENPDDPALKSALRENLDTLRKDADLVADATLAGEVDSLKALLAEEGARALPFDAAMRTFRSRADAAQPSAETLELSRASDEKIDAELLEIFLEEARGVLTTIAAGLAALKERPADGEALTTVRRAFHTLKGSGRMVGLRDFGETAWAVEQTLNVWLRKELDVEPSVLELIDAAHAVFSAWVDHLTGASPELPDVSNVRARARALTDSEENDELLGAPQESPPGGETASERAASVPEISPELRAIFRQESAAHLEALSKGLRELEQDEDSQTPEEMYRAAHTLAGISASVGLKALSALARALQDALVRRGDSGRRASLEAIGVIRQAVDEVEQMLFDESREVAPPQDLIDALDALYPARPSGETADPGTRAEAGARTETQAAVGAQTLSAQLAAAAPLADEIDEQLLPIFLEEAADLTTEIAAQLRLWRENASGKDAARTLARLLHTLKGGARMVGAMNLGQVTHILESWVEKTLHAQGVSSAGSVDKLDKLDKLNKIGEIDEIGDVLDGILRTVENLQTGGLGEEARPALPEAKKAPDDAQAVAPPEAAKTLLEAAEAEVELAPRQAMLRVRAALVDRLVGEAGELSIARAQIEGEMRGFKDSLIDLTENVTRLRRYLRDIHIQAESRMQSHTAQAATAHGEFDPLEFDRFTRFQELTRMMAESVNDVGNVQQNLLKNLDSVHSALLVQSRLNKEIQWDLMTIRMLPFGTIKDRLYRIVRQVSKELGKRVNLEIRGEHVELDRSVLERMIPPLEHLLRNAIAHGIEDKEARAARSKPEIGEISLSLKQESNEIALCFSDDGAGLDFGRIRARALEAGLLKPDEFADEARLASLIFMPGFTTASEISQISGRGVGMDVVKTEVSTLGGRIETVSKSGKGTEFRIYLPLTMAVSQILLLRVGKKNYATPSPMVEQVVELKEEDLARLDETGALEWMGNRYPCHYLPRLLGEARAQPERRPPYRAILLRSGKERVALEVDEVVGSREIIVKNLGPQLSRVVGLDSATVLASGQVVLILNPIALATRKPVAGAPDTHALAEEAGVRRGPSTVMVVDDSLTIRKIANRLLSRNGYQTILARDGVEALELLRDRVPDLMLVDIEMPRMDGFELTRAVRASERTKDIPIIVITSRTADKHRNYAFEIGVNHFLGKPFQEDELLELIRRLRTED